MAFVAVGAYEERGLLGGQKDCRESRCQTEMQWWWSETVVDTAWSVCGLCVEARCSSTSSVVRLGHGILGGLG